ncbi:MAG TPA: hypothetical protein VFS67_12115 [Polyangiaceae bacterium]|jgi:hypothetical protein|nr:hypothetical protein [Polyangiaceae bacterium]
MSSKLQWLTAGWLVLLAACGGSDSAPPSNAPASSDTPGSEQTGVRPLLPSESGDPTAASAELEPGFAIFVDAETGVMLQDVHDADREIVHFDLQRQAMVSAATGEAVSGWTTDGNDLRWDRGGRFRVRFGSEAGEARAYFTEAGPGTICNLSILGPDQLSISATRETPPHT